MPVPSDPLYAPEAWPSAAPARRENYALHLGLFVASLLSCTWAGYVMAGRGALYAATGWGAMVLDGVLFAVPLLAFLTSHEFGHYAAARRHGVDVSLPYYLPFPLLLFAAIPGLQALAYLVPQFGTLGAVIRIREPLRRTVHLFDIGAAGPLAGFVTTLFVLAFALLTLPDPTYLRTVGGQAHEALVQHFLANGTFPPPTPSPDGRITALVFGDMLLLSALKPLFAFFPPMYEIYHYPVLMAAWLALFFTALNLLPVGQLDGGHIVYALFGPRWHARIARATVLLLLLSGALGLLVELPPTLAGLGAWAGLTAPPDDPLWRFAAWLVLVLLLFGFLNKLFDRNLTAVAAALGLLVLLMGAASRVDGLVAAVGYSSWFVWVALILFVIRVDHPPVLIEERLNPRRIALGVLSLLLLLLCFSFKPIYFL